MAIIIEDIKKKISDIEHNISVYTTMHEERITDEDRKVTLDDLYELKAKYEKAIELLSGII
jgi:hypothetical protein